MNLIQLDSAFLNLYKICPFNLYYKINNKFIQVNTKNSEFTTSTKNILEKKTNLWIESFELNNLINFIDTYKFTNLENLENAFSVFYNLINTEHTLLFWNNANVISKLVNKGLELSPKKAFWILSQNTKEFQKVFKRALMSAFIYKQNKIYLQEHSLTDLIYTAVFCDIGKILNESKPHHMWSYKYVEKYRFSKDVQLGVLQHHEYMDGSGLLKYPGWRIHNFAQIIRTVDDFFLFQSGSVELKDYFSENSTKLNKIYIKNLFFTFNK